MGTSAAFIKDPSYIWSEGIGCQKVSVKSWKNLIIIGLKLSIVWLLNVYFGGCWTNLEASQSIRIKTLDFLSWQLDGVISLSGNTSRKSDGVGMGPIFSAPRLDEDDLLPDIGLLLLLIKSNTIELSSKPLYVYGCSGVASLIVYST